MAATRTALRFAVALMIAAIACLTGAPASAEDDAPEVLVLHSYHSGLSWTDGVTDGLREVLQDAGELTLCLEYMDSKRHPVDEVEEPLVELLRARYSGAPPSVVVVVDNNALDLIKRRREELFPGTPIVFCGINHFGPELIDDSGYYTGVVEQTDAARTFAAMRGLLPDLERCIVIGDRTATGQAEIRAAQEALGGEYEGVKVEYWRDLTLTQILNRLPVLRAGEDAVLLTVLNRDASGQFFTYEESGRQICQASPVPVFGLWDFYLDTGVVGGRMASAPDQGRAAGQLVLRILAGRRPAELPIVGDSPNRDIFDYRAMARHGLSEDHLPAGSTLINKPTARDRRLWMAAYWALGFAGLVIIGAGLASWVSTRRGRKRSRFSREIARATVLLPVLAAAFGSGLWMAQDYVGFNAEVADLRERLTQECREEVKQQVDQAMEHVAYERAEEDKHLRKQLLLRTEQAHRLAEHLCAEHADEPLRRRQELVEEALTAMRWDDGEGYYFAIDTDGVAWVYPPSPEIEGEIIREFADQYSEGMVDKMIHVASVHGQGFVEYLWPRTDGAEPSTKFAHVRYLEPLGWIIGTGMYMEDLTAHTQEMVRDRLAAMSFADGEGYIFVKSFDGTELVNRAQPHLVGQNLWEMEDAEGSKVVQEIVQAAYDPDGAYVTYSWVAPGRDEPTPKLSYVRGVTDWGWAVGAGLHLDRIEGAVADKRETMRAEFVVRLVLMLLSSSIVAAACAWIGRRAGGALAGEFDRFHRAFADSLARRRPIDRESFLYSEFRALADGVNGNVQRLRDSEQRLAATLNSIGDGVVCTDAQGRVTRLNPIAESLTGWSGDEAQGRPVETVFRIFHGATGETAANPVLQAMAEGRIFELANNTVLIHRDGTPRQIADSAAPIRDVDGTVVGGVLVFRDVTAEYRMREALRASEEMHRSLFEGSPNCIILCEAGGRIVTINEHGTAALGLEDEIADRRFLDLWPEAGREVVEQGIDRVLAADMPTFEASYLRPDGEGLEWLCALSPVTDADGQVSHFICVLTDITDRVRSEEALERSREQFMLAVRGSQDGIWDWDLRDNSLFISARWKEQIGYQDHEIPNVFESFAERLHPEDTERVMRTVQEYLAGHLPRYQIEFRLRHKDGSYRWILARGEAIRGEDGTPFRMAGSHTDITPLKAAEEALAEGRDRLERILGAVQSCVMLIDSETHNVLEVNKAACQAIGLPREEIVGQLCHQFVCPAEKGRCPITDLCQTVDNSERVLVKADGDHIPILKTVCEVEIDGRPCLVESFVDISHQKHQEEALREALQEAEDLNRRLEQQTMAANELAIQAEEASLAKSRFLANMSHEIRTPMNGVIGMTGLLLDTSLTPDQRSYAETVRTSADALLDLLNDILDFSKIEAGRLELEELDFDPRAVVEEATSLLAPKAHEKRLEMVCSVDAGVPDWLRGDPGRLRQVLVNLVSNAVKFTHEGEVVVSAEVAGETDDQVTLSLEVRDTGIGIPEDKQALLFESFTQVDSSTTRRFGGTGLGLSISRQLVEMMGGRIEVESTEDEGSTFRAVVPFDRAASARPTDDAPKAIQGSRVLVVDDNTTNRQVLLAQLAAWGAHASAVEDGDRALDRLRRAERDGKPFDAALLDMQMPGLDGEGLCRAVKDDPAIAGTHLVLLTSLGTDGRRAALREMGFAACLAKPVRPSILRRQLDAVIAGERQQTESHTPGDEGPRGPDLSGVRVLLAEDNLTNQKVAMGVLERFGAVVEPVENGAAAILALEQGAFDVVLMDVQMPLMDGLETTRAIRAADGRELQPTVPIIAMTAHAMESDRQKCLDAGMDDYLAKPIDAGELVERVAKWSGHAPARVAERPGPVAPEADVPVLDWDGLLRRSMDDPELAAAVLDTFLDDAPGQIEDLRRSLADADAESARRRAHALKGAAANAGAEAMRYLALSAERFGDLEEAARLARELEEALADVIRERQARVAL